MPVNLELKVKIPTFVGINKNLKEIGAEKISELEQKDVYYKVERGLLKLRSEGNERKLIFYDRDEKSKNRWSEFKLLFINDPSAEKFLEYFLSVEVVVKKVRQLYMYDNTRIHLDRVKNLGIFLELETLVIGTKADAMKRFSFIKSKLELHQYEEIRASYRNLMLEKKRR